MALPYIPENSPNSILNQVETKWKAQLDPLLANPLTQGLLLTDIQLINGTTVVPHKLGRKMQGWMITDINTGTTVYRSTPFNATTLTLTSGANCMVSLWVF